MPTPSVILDDLWRHVHWCTSKAITHGREGIESMVVIETVLIRSTTGPLESTMIFGEDFRSAKVYEFDNSKMIE